MVVIAESTRKLLGNLFDLQDLGAQELKGIAGAAAGLGGVCGKACGESRFEALHAQRPDAARRTRRGTRAAAAALGAGEDAAKDGWC